MAKRERSGWIRVPIPAKVSPLGPFTGYALVNERHELLATIIREDDDFTIVVHLADGNVYPPSQGTLDEAKRYAELVATGDPDGN